MKNLVPAVFVLCFIPMLHAEDIKNPKQKLGIIQEQENPFKKALVGDWAKYKMATAAGGIDVAGQINIEVIEKTEKMAKLRVTTKIGNMDLPKSEQEIDLTKPYDPLSSAQLPKTADVKIEKNGSGTEEISVNSKKYNTEWTKVKLSGKGNGFQFEGDAKIWIAKTVPLGGMVRMELNSKIVNNDIKMTMDLVDFGSKK